VANDQDGGWLNRPWPGSGNSNHVFTTQDFFDPRKTSAGFVHRLSFVSTTNSSYDRTTYYRLLSQLGNRFAPEKDKLNLNYKNIGGLSATNLVPWTARTSSPTRRQDDPPFHADWLAADARWFRGYVFHNNSRLWHHGHSGGP